MTQHSTGPFQQTNRWALLAALVAATFAPLLVSAPAAAHMTGMFKTKQEAAQGAAQEAAQEAAGPPAQSQTRRRPPCNQASRRQRRRRQWADSGGCPNRGSDRP